MVNIFIRIKSQNTTWKTITGPKPFMEQCPECQEKDLLKFPSDKHIK